MGDLIGPNPTLVGGPILYMGSPWGPHIGIGGLGAFNWKDGGLGRLHQKEGVRSK